MQQWETEVRQDILAAGLSQSLALRNHIPELLDDIAQIFLEKKDDQGGLRKSDKYVRTLDKNKFHGKLRAETENYTIDQVIQEYFILHRIVSDMFQEKELMSVNIANLLKHILERTIMQASLAFSSAIQDMQDKLIGTLAHDIRNPLTTALAAAELLTEAEDKNDRLIGPSPRVFVVPSTLPKDCWTILHSRPVKVSR